MRRLAIIVLCVFLLTLTVSAAGDEITDLTGDITVDASGTCRLTVRADITFTTAPREVVFPLGAGARDISATGGSFSTRTVNGVKCVVFKSDIGFSGTQTFTCSYRLPVSAAETETGQRFVLYFPPIGWDYPIDRFSVRVQLPFEPETLPTWESAYYGDVVDNYLDIEMDGAVLTASSRQIFKDHETLTMTLDAPAGSFDLRNLPGRTASVDRILFYIFLGAAVLYWLLRLRGRLFLPKTRQSLSVESTAGEIPCQLYGREPDAAAMLAHWGNLGYISIHRNRRGRIILGKLMDMGNERKPAERKLFRAIFGKFSTCDAQSLRFRQAVYKSGGAIRRGWAVRIFGGKSGDPRVLKILGLLAGASVGVLVFDLMLPANGFRWFWLPILSLIFTALCLPVQSLGGNLLSRRRLLHLILGLAAAAALLLFGFGAGCQGTVAALLLFELFIGLLTMFGGRRTRAGEDMLRQLLGLRRFLRKPDRDTLNRLTQADAQYFYRMLPFAEMLGVAWFFSKRFGDRYLEPCTWLSDARKSTDTAMGFYRLYRELVTVIREENFVLPKLPRLNAPGRRVRRYRRRPAAVHPSASASQRRPNAQRRPHRAPEYYDDREELS